MPSPKTSEGSSLSCPSSWAGKPEAVVFAIVGGTADAPRLRYLPEAIPVTQPMFGEASRELASKARVSAPCDRHSCQNFDGVGCRLPAQVVTLPIVADAPLPCLIRPTCVWFHQEGKAACLRCPQIVASDPLGLFRASQDTYDPSQPEETGGHQQNL